MSRTDARSLGVIWGGLWTPRATNGPILDVRGAPPGGPVSGETAGAATPTTAANFPASLGYAAGRRHAFRPGDRLARLELRAGHPAPGARGAAPGTDPVVAEPPDSRQPARDGGQRAEVPDHQPHRRAGCPAGVDHVPGRDDPAAGHAPRRRRRTHRAHDIARQGRGGDGASHHAPSSIAPIVATRQHGHPGRVVDGGTVVIAGLRQERSRTTSVGFRGSRRCPCSAGCSRTT